MKATFSRSVALIALAVVFGFNANALDVDMARFATLKKQEVVKLAGPDKVPVQVLSLFDAIQADDWDTATNLAAQIRKSRYMNTNFSAGPDKLLKTIWPPVQDTIGAYKEFHSWDNRLLHEVGNNIINSIPKGSIFLGGTDPGYYIVSALEASEPDARRFCVIAPSEMIDHWYVEYVYDTDAGKHWFVRIDNDGVTDRLNKAISGVKVEPYFMAMKPTPTSNVATRRAAFAWAQYTALQVELQFEQHYFNANSKTEVYYEESIPYEWMYPYLPSNSPSLRAQNTYVRPQDKIMEKFFVQECPTVDWMYPNLSPAGFVMHLSHEKIKNLSEETVQKDREFWTHLTAEKLGREISSETPLNAVCAMNEKLFLQKSKQDFKGSTPFIESKEAQRCFSKFRCAQAGLYVWRMLNADTAAEKERMRAAADLSYKQAFALCADSTETVGCYALFLLDAKRWDDAELIVRTALHIGSEDPLLKELLNTVRGAR